MRRDNIKRLKDLMEEMRSGRVVSSVKASMVAASEEEVLMKIEEMGAEMMEELSDKPKRKKKIVKKED